MKSPKELHERCLELLSERGVELEQIAELVYFLQERYVPGLTKEECLLNVNSVLKKREVQNAVITGIEMDKLAKEITSIIKRCLISRRAFIRCR